MKEKILITGAAGYIGSVLVPELLRAGYAVTALDNFMYGQTPLLEVCHDPKFAMVRGDARDQALVKKHLKDADIIIPLACYTGAPLCAQKPQEAKAVSLDAIKQLLKMRSKQQKILFPNTNSGYGIGQKDQFCTEKTPLKPISLYGKWKVAAEQAILDSGNAVTFRLATVFGMSPRMRLDLLVNDFVYRAVNDRFIVVFEPHFKRNYIHIRDVARAFMHGIDNFAKMKNNSYNVGLSNANLSKWELCQTIQKQLPDFHFMEAPLAKDPDKRNYIVSNEKIEKTDFKPKTSLDAGIAELIKGYQVLKRNNFSNI